MLNIKFFRTFQKKCGFVKKVVKNLQYRIYFRNFAHKTIFNYKHKTIKLT